MPRQLDILALEPFHGGGRRTMLEAISRCSRHRWKILKLPARRFERRLLVAATWFAEYIARNDIGHIDALFASEALNLADFLRLQPRFAKSPSVVYFHDNQLPEPSRNRVDTPTDLVNLNSAMAATEIWFNSLFNLRSFLSRASGLVERHRELRGHDPLAGLAAKARLIPPPVDMAALRELVLKAPARDAEIPSLLVDGRGADSTALADALETLEYRTPRLRLTLIGRIKGLALSFRPLILSERDDEAHVRALLSSAVLLTARPSAAADDLAVRALSLGVHVAAPRSGVYADLLPRQMHASCLHDATAASMVERVLEGWNYHKLAGLDEGLPEILAQFDAIRACKLIDEQLDRVASLTPAKAPSLPEPTFKPSVAAAFARL